MSLSAISELRTAVDFTDENVAGLRMPYTSFENRLKNQQSASMNGVGQGQQNLESLFDPVPKRCIDISLARSTKPKSIAAKLAKLKESEPINYTIQQPLIPNDVPTYTFTLDPSKLICFYGRDNFLSNYFTAPMTVNSVGYRSVEHYYEACKLFSFGGAYWANQINKIKDPGAAKVTSKRLMQYVDRRRVEAWKRTEGLSVIEHALMHKFKTNSDLAEKLLNTGDAFLAHCNPHDTLWGTGLNAEKLKQWATDNQSSSLKIPRCMSPSTMAYYPTTLQGQNALGYLLMQIRRLLAEKSASGGGNNSSAVVTTANESSATQKANKDDVSASKHSGAVVKAPQAPIGTAPNKSNVVPISSSAAADNVLTSLDKDDTVHKIAVQMAMANINGPSSRVGGL
uniref:NADAR domain-containing protein n=1 Tax=Romanomermis culicivorax TaxID=13658 RepID=A0A915JN22_ROMCU